MDFSLINNVAKINNLPVKRLKELHLNEKYFVTNLKQVTTKYGEKFVATIDDEYKVYLPKYVNDLLLNDSDYCCRMIDMAHKNMLNFVYRGAYHIEFCN